MSGSGDAILETSGEIFRILQLTDFHSDVEEALNERTRSDVRAMVAHFRPHLLAVTGDIWCGDDRPNVVPMWMRRDLEFLGELGIPWAFTWGNHDYYADFDNVMRQIAATPNAVVPHGNRTGSYRIEVRTLDAAHPCWDLFFLNSGTEWHLPEDLDWFREEVDRINAARGCVVPAIVYFHIPLCNYQAAINEGRTIGTGDEEVLHWGDDENVAAPILKAVGRGEDGVGNVRACFCGHSHRNDFHFEEEGVVFGYGRATGYGGYGGEDLAKGGKLLELNLTEDAFTFRTVFADGST